MGGDPYDTQLSSEDESKYQDWKKKYAPKDSGSDYDLRGAFKAGVKPDPETGHWPDTFKKPNHPTFSNESVYAKFAPEKAGHWEGDKFIPPPIIPDVGAARYWYVDPRAGRAPFNPMIYADEQGHTGFDIENALRRLGVTAKQDLGF